MNEQRISKLNIVLLIIIVILVIVTIILSFKYFSKNQTNSLSHNINEDYTIDKTIVLSDFKINEIISETTSAKMLNISLNSHNITSQPVYKILEIFFYDKEGHLIDGFEYYYQSGADGKFTIEENFTNLKLKDTYHYEVKTR